MVFLRRDQIARLHQLDTGEYCLPLSVCTPAEARLGKFLRSVGLFTSGPDCFGPVIASCDRSPIVIESQSDCIILSKHIVSAIEDNRPLGQAYYLRGYTEVSICNLDRLDIFLAVYRNNQLALEDTWRSARHSSRSCCNPAQRYYIFEKVPQVTYA